MIATQTQEIHEEWKSEIPGPDEPRDRDELIQSLLPTVDHIAARVASKLPSHVAKEDLISAGVLGLIDAVDRYDASKGCSLKTYSGLRIHGAIMDELRRLDWVPRTVHRDEKIYDTTSIKLAQKLGREPEPEEIRRELGMTPDAFEKFLERTQTAPSFSLNEAWSDEDGNSVDRGECVANNAAPTALEEVLRKEDRLVLREELDRMPRAEKLVLCLYYMEDVRLKEIAMILGVSESRVSQIHTEALRKITVVMREALAA